MLVDGTLQGQFRRALEGRFQWQNMVVTLCAGPASLPRTYASVQEAKKVQSDDDNDRNSGHP